MVSVHRFHDISESNHRVMNPFSIEKVDVLADIVALQPGITVLDLASGKGEMLCRYASHHGITGVGVDLHEPLVHIARDRAHELGVEDRVSFVLAEAAAFAGAADPHDVIMCIGASWIGGGLAGTLDLMRPVLRPDGVALVGEPYAIRRGTTAEGFPDLAGLLDTVEGAGFELLEMVLASTDDWDRYMASQWLNVALWLDEHPDDPDAADVRAERDRSRRGYLSGGRDELGWGVFVVRPTRG